MRKVVELGRQPMGWQEILLETGAAASVPEAIIATWSKPGTWAQVATTGHRSVVSLPSSLYLDGAATSGGATVRGRIHAGCWFDIASGAANATNERYLLGGEASMWSDQVCTRPLQCSRLRSHTVARCSTVPSGTQRPRPVLATISRSRRGLWQVCQRHHLAACCHRCWLILAVGRESKPNGPASALRLGSGGRERDAHRAWRAKLPMRQRDLQWLRRRDPLRCRVVCQ